MFLSVTENQAPGTKDSRLDLGSATLRQVLSFTNRISPKIGPHLVLALLQHLYLVLSHDLNFILFSELL